MNGKVILNKKGDGFTIVPEEVWNFYVGGYQVCQKWLKERKGCTLSTEDITHYQRIVVALQETIRLMQQIDAAIPGCPWSEDFTMKLPNGDQAQLGDKLERYVLNSQHPKGKDKAALFKNRLGITLENKEILENILLDVAINQEAILYKQD